MTRHLKFAALSLAACLLASTLASAKTVSEQILHTFSQRPNGSQSQAGLIADAAGNLYGTTVRGGAYGVVFRLSRNTHGQWIETVLHNFTGGYGGPDGAYPAGSVTFDSAGNLYGTTSAGGNYGCGTAYKLSPVASGPWKETILHSFACYPSDGATPNGNVIFDSAGNIYGITGIGGSGGCGDGYTTYGCGTVYELSPSSNGYVQNILYSFGTNSSNETNPAGPLVFDKSGNLYGTASSGGTGHVCYYYGCGTVFTLTKGTTGWTESTIYDFTGINDGDTPVSGVTFDGAGNMYVTTEGYWGYGSVIELSPNAGSWSETTLYDGNPNLVSLFGGVVFDTAGNLYSTSFYYGRGTCTGTSCGAIFELSPGSSGWTETRLYTFTGSTDGEAPYATLLRDSAGNLYTTTSAGANGAGSVFELSPSGGTWTGTVLYDFPVLNDGTVPYSGLFADGAGNFYGTTTYGGSASAGTVYKLSPAGNGAWKETVLYNFTGANGDGAYPLGNLLLDAQGNIYGTTELGGIFSTSYCNNVNAEQCGTVFKLSPNGNGTYTETILHSFAGYGTGDGSNPSAGLIMDSSGNLYGTTKFGGAYGGGTAFKLTPSSGGTWTETILASFGSSFSDAWSPSGPLTRDSAGNLYGTSDSSSNNNYPTVFRLSPSGSGYTESVLFTFATQDEGYSPQGGVVLDSAGNLYGTANRGGLDQGGLVYKLTPSSGAWTQTVIHTFTGVNGDGWFPQATLTFDGNGNLYGTTVYGGIYNGACNVGCGTVFALTPNSNGTWRETIWHRFTAGQDGSAPWAPVLIDAAGNIYGTASAGGNGASGVVFEIKP